MGALIGYLTELHRANLPLYALVTVLSMGVTGVTVGRLATGLASALGAGSGRAKGSA